jgi:hypothetical protein
MQIIEPNIAEADEDDRFEILQERIDDIFEEFDEHKAEITKYKLEQE